MFFGQKSILLLRSLHTLCKDSKSLRLLRIYVTAADISSTHNLLKPYHLRYLEFIVAPTRNLSVYVEAVDTSIPQALTQFYHLQVLNGSSTGNLAVPSGMNNLVNLRHLIAHEKVHSSIASVGNLTSLQELKFKVQDGVKFNIGQLQSMNELVTLRISQLENVKTHEEARSARLMDKEHLEELSLSWGDYSMSPEPTAEKTRDGVLEGLEPHQNLKHLQLIRYSGATSPTWLASNVNSLQILHLENCRGWRIVHSLEMLPLLRNLKLIRMWNLKEVSIPSYLEELVLVNMPKLEKCVGIYGVDLTSGLRVLMVKDCPNLKEFTLFHSDHFHAVQKSWFPSLSKLTIGHCHRIIPWKILPLEEMRALKELKLMDMPVVEELSVPSLEKLVLIQMLGLQSCSGITASPPLQFLASNVNQKEWVSSLRKLTIIDCPSLIVSVPIPPSPLISYLYIKGLPAFPTMKIDRGSLTIASNELRELDGRTLPFHNLKGIRQLYLQNCPNLIYMWNEGFNQLSILERLFISDCPNLFQPHIMSEHAHENSTSNTAHLILPSLKYLRISSCGIAETEATSSSASTQTTSAREDEHLLQIPFDLCWSLKKLSTWSFLEYRGFGGCTSFVKLDIYNCPKLASSLTNEKSNSGLLPTSLEDLRICYLPANLQSFSSEGMPHLKRLSLCCSQDLKSIQLHSCTALVHLQIRECPHLVVLEGLQQLSSLRRLDIELNPELSSAWDLKLPEQEQGGNQARLFPLSLVEFCISNLESSIHSRFFCLPSITKLELWDSPALTSVQLGHCTALENLKIYKCKSLASIEGFQSIRNLRSLEVLDSSSLLPYLQQEASAFWSRLETLKITDATMLSTNLCKQLTSVRRLIFWFPDGNSDEPMVSLTEEQERALQLLTSLRQLCFEYCKNLESLPANLRSLDSLEDLRITGSQRIKRLPEMGLPPSLNYLHLFRCSEELCMQCRMVETEKLMLQSVVGSWIGISESVVYCTHSLCVGGSCSLHLRSLVYTGKACNAAACINPEGSCTEVVSSSMGQIISWAMHDRKRKREEGPTHNIKLPIEIKCDISERINGVVDRLRLRAKSVQEVLKLDISGHNTASKQTQGLVRNRRLTTSIQVERKVHGRDAEKDSIIELLTKGKSSDLGVLPLVGVGGVGKTTLARYVYHDQRIQDHFDLLMWVCVSDNFNEQRLTCEMLEHVCSDRHGYGNIISFDVLQKTLQEKIRHKRFLLVLDDMWEDGDRSGWEKLLAPLKCNEANGCMILATTRKTSVARMIGTMSKVEVNGLGEREFWLLFKACAFYGNVNQESDPVLQSIGKHIAKELKGNPLAARSVGALLNRSVSFEHWRKVQYKWKFLLEHDDHNILSILKFSYEFLPVHLQRCFSYCSLFPKDHQFTWGKLVSAWISQNFVRCEHHTERLDETGKQYLDDLVDCGFFEEVESHYVMHDLMHDLAQKVSQNECATVDGLEYKKNSPGVQHLSITTTAYDKEEHCKFPSEKFENILQNIVCLQKLRTLMFFGRKSILLLRVEPTVNIFGYLDIVNACIPQALTKFYHLQVLDASSLANIIVPSGMNNLVNLRHIIAHEKVHSEISGVGNLTSLQELTFKVQDASNNFNIGQLRSMNELVILRISQLENVKTKEEAKSARLIDKEHLQQLSLSWDDYSMSSEPTAEKTRDDVLEGLEPHQNLKDLQLTRYSGATSPTWLANNVTSLQTLHLENCRGWRIVKSLEMLPVPRKLKLIRMWNLISVSIPSYLEELVLVNTPKLEKCIGTYGPDLTSGLRVLMVKDCPRLNKFTLFHSDYFHTKQKSWFPSLKKLTIGRCHCIIEWKILPLEEMGVLKELELMDVPFVEELSVPSLEKLVLIQMPSLQRCSGITASPPLPVSTSQVHQKELVSSLRKLTINDCRSLTVSIPIPPSPQISDLSIMGLSAFPTVEICQRTFSIQSNKLTGLDGRILPFHNLKGIRSMHLENCPNLICMSSEGFNQLLSLETLFIYNCPNLLPPHIVSEHAHENSTSNTKDPILPSLKYLRISSCGTAGRWLTPMLPHLQSLEDLDLWECPQIKHLLMIQPTETDATSSLASAEATTARDEQTLQIPCNILRSLKMLRIWSCPDLEFSGVNGGFGGCTSLVHLEVKGCPKLVSSLMNETNNNGLLPMSLQDLNLSPLLQSFSPEGLPHLKKLSLDSQYLESLQLNSCMALEYLQILGCQQLGVLEGLQHLSSLRRLDIHMNPELSAAWDRKLQEQGQGGSQGGLFPLSLAELVVRNFEGSIHPRFLSCLPSLTKLELQYCPHLTSLQLGYCTALEELKITFCEELASIEGFQSIRNLRV
uniref:Uncharacterized protein n=1 Tax=Oryza glumipatula TaxID=40148 RepID=A0A0D9YLE2_9ORYZ